MIDDRESDLNKEYKDFCLWVDEAIIGEAKQRKRLENTLFKRFMRWVRNDI